jgi:hypothetical protein
MEGAAWVDDAAAAENAGALGAMSSTRELVAMASDPAPQTRAFALAALTHVLVVMQERRLVKPTEAQQHAAESAIGSLCEEHLGEDEADVLHQALHCVYRASRVTSAPAVAALAAYHRDAAVRSSAAVAFTGVYPRSPIPGSSVRLDPRVAAAMLARLRAPLSRSVGVHEIHAREWLCNDLETALPRYTPGLGETAEAAATMIDAHPARPGPSRGCRELAKRELTPPPPQEPLLRGADGDDAYCEQAQIEAQPWIELCVDGAAMGTDAAQLAVTIRDRRGREPGGERHQLVARFPVRIEPGQRSVLAQTRWPWLSDTVRVGLIPIVKRGATPEDDARSLTVVVVDIARRTIQDVARTPWCRGCNGVGTRSGRGEFEVTESRNDQKAQLTSFRWDGVRLRLE